MVAGPRVGLVRDQGIAPCSFANLTLNPAYVSVFPDCQHLIEPKFTHKRFLEQEQGIEPRHASYARRRSVLTAPA